MQSNKYIFFLLLLSILLLHSCDRIPYPQGERIYKSQCANCHMDEGQGLGTLIPPIKESDYYLEHYENLVCLITNGLDEKIVVNGVEFDEVMPAARKLTDAEMSNLINYMNSQWYPSKEEVNLQNIKEYLQKCESK